MMTRVEQIGDATLYLGDCLDVIPTLGTMLIRLTPKGMTKATRC